MNNLFAAILVMSVALLGLKTRHAPNTIFLGAEASVTEKIFCAHDSDIFQDKRRSVYKDNDQNYYPQCTIWSYMKPFVTLPQFDSTIAGTGGQAALSPYYCFCNLGQCQDYDEWLVTRRTDCSISDNQITLTQLNGWKTIAESAIQYIADTGIEVIVSSQSSPLSFTEGDDFLCGLITPLDVTLGDKDQNILILVTAVPPPNTTTEEQYLFQDQPTWAMPCGFVEHKFWSNQKNKYLYKQARPSTIRLNFNPAKARTMTDEALLQNAVHQILHALSTDMYLTKHVKNDLSGNLGYNGYYYNKQTSEAQMSIHMKCTDRNKVKGFAIDEGFEMTGLRGSKTNEMSFSHWEPRVHHNDILAAGNTGMNITIQTLTLIEQVRGLRATGEWKSDGLRPSIVKSKIASLEPSPSSFPGDGCGVYTDKCDTTNGGKDLFFCFDGGPGSSCAADHKSVSPCGVRQWEGFEIGGAASTPIPSYQQYFSTTPTKTGGLSLYKDFCPTQGETATNCLTSSEATSVKQRTGTTFGSSSRCFGVANDVHSDTYTSSGDTSGVRCLNVRCPFGSRLEFQVFGSAAWNACPQNGDAGDVDVTASGWTGKLSCPIASKICTDTSLTPTIAAPTWSSIGGYAIEYGVVDGAASRQAAADVCTGFGGSLAFLPDTYFAETVGQAVADAPFWTGMLGTGTWAADHNYTSVISAPTMGDTDNCVAFSKTSGGMTEVLCNNVVKIVCTRPLNTFTPGNCAQGTLCQLLGIVDVTKRYDVYTPVNPFLVNHTGGEAACGEAEDELFDLGAQDETSAKDGFAKLSAAMGTMTVARIGNRVTGTYSAPTAYSNAVMPSEEGSALMTKEGEVCFALATATGTVSAANWAYMINTVSCQSPMPALCMRSATSGYEGGLPGYMRSFKVHRVPMTVTDAATVCANYGGANAGSPLPMISQNWADEVVSHFTWMGKTNRLVGTGGNKDSIQAGARRDQSGPVYEQFKVELYTAAMYSAFLPKPPQYGALAEGRLAMERTKTVPMTGGLPDSYGFKIQGTSEALPFGCVTYNPTMALKTTQCNAPALSAGTIQTGSCWDKTSDYLFRFVADPQTNAAANSFCDAAGSSTQLLAPPLASQWSQSLETLFKIHYAGAGNALWTGLYFDTTKTSKVAYNGVEVTTFDVQGGDIIGTWENGECIALSVYNNSEGTTKWGYVARDCNVILPFICKESIAGSSSTWTTFAPLSSPTDERRFLDYIFLGSTRVEFSAAQTMCKALDGDLAYLKQKTSGPATFDTGSLWTAMGLTPILVGWFGLRDDAPVKFEATFHVGTTAEQGTGSNCYQVRSTGSITSRPCSGYTRYVLCARPNPIVNWSAHDNFYGAGTGKIQVNVPETANSAGSVTMRGVSSNVTGLVFGDEAISSNSIGWLTYTIPCSIFGSTAAPIWSGFTISIVTEDAGVRRTEINAVNRSSATLWPCLSVWADTTQASVLNVISQDSGVVFVASNFVTPNLNVEYVIQYDGTGTLNFTVLGGSGDRVILNATNPSAFINFTGGTPGTGNIRADRANTNCFLDGTCPSAPSTIPLGSYTVRYLTSDLIRAETQAGVLFTGSEHQSPAGIWLVNDPLLATVDLLLTARPKETPTVVASSVFLTVAGDFCTTMQFGSFCNFTITGTVAGDFEIYAQITVTNRDGAGANSLFDDALRHVASVTFSPIYPLTLGLELRRPLKLYAGESFLYTVESSVEATNNGANVGVSLVDGPALPSPTYYTVTPNRSSVLVENSTCCKYTMPLLMTSDILESMPTEVDLEIVPIRTGNYVVRFALPSPPRVRLIIKKRIVVFPFPSKIMAGGTLHPPAVLTLPQTPVMRMVSIFTKCNDSLLLFTPDTQSVFRPNDWNGTKSQNVTFSVPSNLYFGDREYFAVTCTFTVEGGADFISEDIVKEIMVYPRGMARLIDEAPTFAVPGDSFSLTIEVFFNRDSPPVDITAVGNATGGVLVSTSGNRVFSGRTERTFAVQISANAPPSQGLTCVTFDNTNPENYETPNSTCFHVLPLVYALVNGGTDYKQPVGAGNARTIDFTLNSVPTLSDVTLHVGCKPEAGKPPAAAFSPSTLFWPKGNPDVKRNLTMTGLLIDRSCDAQYMLVAEGRELKSNGTLISIFDIQSGVYFVSLLTITMNSNMPLNKLFLGTPNTEKCSVSIPVRPSKPVNITLVYTGEPGTVVIEPAAIHFAASSDERLIKYFTVTALQLPELKRNFNELAYIQSEVTTDASEFDPLVRGNISFVVSPLYEVQALQNGARITNIDLYCNGDATPQIITFYLTGSPVSPRDTVRVSLDPVSATNWTTAPDPKGVLLLTSPAQLSFIGTMQSQTMELICPREQGMNAREDIQQMVYWTVRAPFEYGPAPSFSVTLKAQDRFTVTNFPTVITVGAAFPATFNVKPSSYRQDGSTLSLAFINTCDDKIQLVVAKIQLESGAAAPLDWTGDSKQRNADLWASAPVSECAVTILLSENNTAATFNRQDSKFEAIIKAVAQPRIYPLQSSPTVGVADFVTGLVWKFLVEETTPLIGGSFSVVLGGTLDKADNYALVQQTLFGHCIAIYTEIAESDPSSLMAMMRETPGMINVTEANGELLVVIQNTGMPTIVYTEKAMVVFGRKCLQRQQAPPNPDFSNWTFTVEPTDAGLGDARKATMMTLGVTSALSSFSSSAALATQGAKLSSLVDASTCPMRDWKYEKQRDLSRLANPMNVQIGSKDNLGVYFGAAVMNCIFVVGWVFVHMCVSFIYFGMRRDHNVVNKTFSNSLAEMRFPSLELFPVAFFSPFIFEQGMKVAIYSPNGGMRAGGVICVLLSVAAVGWVLKVIRLPGVVYEGVDFTEREYTFFQKLHKSRGRWVLDPEVRDNSLFLKRYQWFFEDFVGPWKLFYFLDLLMTMVLAGVNSAEPTTSAGCASKFAAAGLLFIALLGLIILGRPFRRHIFNIFFAAVAFLQAASILATVGASAVGAATGRGSDWVLATASVVVTILCIILILKALADLGAVALRGAYRISIKKWLQKRKEKKAYDKMMTEGSTDENGQALLSTGWAPVQHTMKPSELVPGHFPDDYEYEQYLDPVLVEMAEIHEKKVLDMQMQQAKKEADKKKEEDLLDII